jgi:ABC-type multidrug transport system permease subunit
MMHDGGWWMGGMGSPWGVLVLIALVAIFVWLLASRRSGRGR